jgi:hypothetical protein
VAAGLVTPIPQAGGKVLQKLPIEADGKFSVAF